MYLTLSFVQTYGFLMSLVDTHILSPGLYCVGVVVSPLYDSQQSLCTFAPLALSIGGHVPKLVHYA